MVQFIDWGRMAIVDTKPFMLLHHSDRGSQDIEATIIWKTGFQQQVLIHRPLSNSKLERRWTREEDDRLRMMYPSSSLDALIASLPERSWKAIKLRASRLKLNRKRGPNRRRPWTHEDDERLKLLYQQGTDNMYIASQLGRSMASVTQRLRDKGLNRLNPNEKKET